MSASLVGYDVVDDPERGSPPSREQASSEEAPWERASRERAPWNRAATGPDGVVVHLCRFDRGGGSAAAGAPVAALARAAGPHVEAVLDIGTAPNGDPVLVLPRLPWALSDLLADRLLSPGEAVTVLVPLVQTLDRLHAAGVAHGAVGPGAVRFDGAGTPTLTGFHGAVVAQGPRDGRFAAAVAADERALAALASALMHCDGADVPALAGDSGTAVRELFRWAEPEPILLAGQASPPRRSAGETPGRVIPPVDDLADPVPPLLRSSPRRAGRSPDAGGASWTFRSRTTDGTAVRRVIDPLRRMLDPLRRVRRRVWATAGTVLLLLVTATVLLPGHGAEAVGTSVPVSVAPRSMPAATPSARASRVPGEAEPKQAATRLVELRAACLAAGDERCLRPLEASGSPVALLDAAALVAGVEAVRVSRSAAVLRATSGTTATVAFGRATTLIVRQGGYWLLRDVVLPAE